jgi:hypothetical protein
MRTGKGPKLVHPSHLHADRAPEGALFILAPVIAVRRESRAIRSGFRGIGSGFRRDFAPVTHGFLPVGHRYVALLELCAVDSVCDSPHDDGCSDDEDRNNQDDLADDFCAQLCSSQRGASRAIITKAYSIEWSAAAPPSPLTACSPSLARSASSVWRRAC